MDRLKLTFASGRYDDRLEALHNGAVTIDGIDEVDAVFGGDAWPYGLEPNRRTLETLVSYIRQQGLNARQIPLEDLFLPLEV